MTDKVFVDTNIILYAEFDDDSKKYNCAKALLKNSFIQSGVYISTQVLNEFFVNALRKGAGASDIQSVLLNYSNNFKLITIDFQTIRECWRILNRYHFSYWDSLIIAAALEADCSILYSEDMQDGQIIENTLTIRNPFVTQDEAR
ncbi:twitching motility protein PilT [Spirochaetia bacterium]|nr:twitching motility protein PilT [Spirochaetia bacterium]